MSTEPLSRLSLPPQVQAKLGQYRRRLRTIKLIEAGGAALFGLVISYLVIFALDRWIETTAWQRALILVAGTLGLAVWLPWMFHKWVWRSRRWEQVARILKTRHPRLGDYLLGVIELVNDTHTNGRSEALCRAALQQADRETARQDFSGDIPHPRHLQWSLLALVPLVLAGIAAAVVPAASQNAFWRWLTPWRAVERYTFARVEPLPETLIVPWAEPATLSARLQPESLWNPASGSAWVGNQRIDSPQQNGDFEFALPPLQDASAVRVRIGDTRHQVRVEPQPRPELRGLTATINLPAYLQRPQPVQRDIRGGSLSVAPGSQVRLVAEASRELSDASWDGQPLATRGAELETPWKSIDESATVALEWRDVLGLSAKSPLKLKIRAAPDEAPSIVCRELDAQAVIMDKDVLSFQVDASDDYGVKTLGLEWTGTPSAGSEAEPATGEKVIYAGEPTAEEVTAISATFSPRRENIAPQTIQLRIYAEDYLPDRPRVYSATYTVYVLSEEEHAIWLTRQLDEWFKQSLETYEREQQLFKRNVELRNLSAEELDRPETRRKIEAQAAAESAQARRLSALTDRGESLTREAARNDQFGVGHLEKLAEMVNKLRDISDNRMPSVANLLKQAAEAPAGSRPSPNAKDGVAKAGEPSSPRGDSPPTVSDDPGQRPGEPANPAAADAEENADPNQTPKTPSINLRESAMDEKEPGSENAAPPPGQSGGKFSLPDLTLQNTAPSSGGACPAGQKMEEAAEDQAALLAEFQAVAEELQKLIGNLEGSTFVKRLKALSRRELVLASDIENATLGAFGESQSDVQEATRKRALLLAERQRNHSLNLQHVIDDLNAYSNRVSEEVFQTVLKEMNDMEIVNQVNAVAERMVANEPGTSLAQAEFLADTFDRWAEQLAGPSRPGGS